MNIGTTGAVSTLVPQAAAPGTGPSAGQNSNATREVESPVVREPATVVEVGAGPSAVPEGGETRADTDSPRTPPIKEESWATTTEVKSWTGDTFDPDPASARLDVKV